MNVYKEFRLLIIKIINGLQADGTLTTDILLDGVIVEAPRDPSYGELATNAAMVVAKISKKDPLVIANLIKKILRSDERISKIKIVSPGFLNFSLRPSVWHKVLSHAVSNESKFGSSSVGEGKKINIEYVSANPTGPLHVGHTRGAVFGDTLANLLEFMGFQVTREFI